jgi:MOSC domain-containing protein YiiM
LLLISLADLATLQSAGYSVSPGALGENLTVEGIDFRQLRAGQRFRAGGAIIELTRLRRPCLNLDVYNSPEIEPIQQRLFDERAKAGDPTTPRWAMGGFYAAVLQPGLIRQGDTIWLVEQIV